MNLCPCQSGDHYEMCCQRFHSNKQRPDTAEQLMRSRYTAFAKGLVDYLIITLHPSQRQSDDKEVLQESCQNTRWLGLKVIHHQQLTDNKAIVEFAAFYQDTPVGQLHERSNFIHEDGRWFYVDGDMLASVKLARNETCFCGSGKKFKHCHAKE